MMDDLVKALDALWARGVLVGRPCRDKEAIAGGELLTPQGRVPGEDVVQAVRAVAVPGQHEVGLEPRIDEAEAALIFRLAEQHLDDLSLSDVGVRVVWADEVLAEGRRLHHVGQLQVDALCAAIDGDPSTCAHATPSPLQPFWPSRGLVAG